MDKVGLGRKYEGWFEEERRSLPFNVECRHRLDCCWVEVNPSTLTCWGYYQILDIGVSMTFNSVVVCVWSSLLFAEENFQLLSSGILWCFCCLKLFCVFVKNSQCGCMTFSSVVCVNCSLFLSNIIFGCCPSFSGVCYMILWCCFTEFSSPFLCSGLPDVCQTNSAGCASNLRPACFQEHIRCTRGD